MQERKIDLVINDPEAGDKELVTDGYLIRRCAVDFGVSLITNIKVAALLALSLERVKSFHIKSMEVSEERPPCPSRPVTGVHPPSPLPARRGTHLQEYYQTTSLLDTSG